MKKIYLFLLALVCTIGAWAESITTDWVDYSTEFNNAAWTNAAGGSNAVGGFLRKGVSTTPEGSVPVTVQVTTADNYLGYATQENYKRPWFKAGKTFTISVPQHGVKILAYEIKTKKIGDNVQNGTFKYTSTSDGVMGTSPVQTEDLQTIKVENLEVNSITIDLSECPVNGNGGFLIYNLRLKLEIDWVDVTINVKNNTDNSAQISKVFKVLPGETITLRDFFPEASFVTYAATTATVSNDNNTFDLGYTVDEESEAAIPFVTSFDQLNDQSWVCMYTLNGRMHVRDVNANGTNVAKYPTIDKATFTRLNDNYFWGFVRANRFSPTYIVNKAAGPDQKLYLTVNGDDVPVLLATEANKGANWVTNEWVLEKSTKQEATATGDKYFGIRALGTNKYINNNANKGFMTTWHDNQNKDNGSNHKFINEISTYEILKERALNAPAGAVHSLNVAARKAIKDNTNNTVEGYKAVIAEINQTTGSETGFIEFDESKYYVLRNYTPEGGNVYVLGSDNGTGSRTFTVSADEAGDVDNIMTFSNVNAIWKITKNGEAAGGDGLGASRTTPRLLTHVNSAKKLAAANNRTLNDNGANYYFIDLGAGQHFLKNVQYSGTGNQAKAKPLSCADNGNVKEGDNAHFKNSRDAWYGIPVSDIKVTIGAAGWATLHLPFGVDLPENSGLTAYVVSDIATADGANIATLTEVTSIPANQGVILKGAAGPYSLTINDAAAWTTGVTNKLRGSNLHENVTDEAYVLSMPAGKNVGLYKAQMSGTSWLNNDNKAYLPASEVPAAAAGAQSLSFVFDGTETSIEGVEAAKAGKSAVYDLSGRRVKSAVKGIYIINGKKVVK